MILLCPKERNLVLLSNNTVYENYTKHRRNKRSLVPKFPRRINFTTDGWRNFVTQWSDSIYRASALRSLPAGKASSFLWCLQQIWKRTDYSDPNKSSSSFFSGRFHRGPSLFHRPFLFLPAEVCHRTWTWSLNRGNYIISRRTTAPLATKDNRVEGKSCWGQRWKIPLRFLTIFVFLVITLPWSINDIIIEKKSYILNRCFLWN